jgi:hypothetical protein
MVIGGRYIVTENTYLVKPAFTWTDTGTRTRIEKKQQFSAEVGLTGSMPFDQAGQHQLNGGVMLTGGYQTEEMTNATTTRGRNWGYEGGIIGWDTVFGYSFSSDVSNTFTARYRANIQPTTGALTGYGVVHGPELAWSMRF